MSLEIIPEQLPIIGAQQTANAASLSAAASATQVAATPVPAAADAVSSWAASFFSAYQPTFFGMSTHPGIANLITGSQELTPVAALYTADDLTGSANVSAAGSTVPR
ncbi:PE domain-containing protein [Nocardia sp. NPDC006044]|uniref:PE domain-containing protein n=1 Tax=Nocardia sp. NPDC006044 TaxID=3364306 RepID=UPI003686E14C